MKCRTFGRTVTFLIASAKTAPGPHRTPVLRIRPEEGEYSASSEFIWGFRLEGLGNGAPTMKKHTGEDATAAYSPKEGHSVVIYTHKFKPEHFREGDKIVTKQFPAASLNPSKTAQHI